MKKLNIFIFIIIPAGLLLFSCRMDVVDPIIIESETNNPLQDTRLNFLNYELVADDYTGSTSIPLSFSVSRARIHINLIGHTEGLVQLEIKNANQQTVFHTEMKDNYTSYIRNLSDPNLSRLFISHQNFTGKFKIQILAAVD
ncbi:MAG: hypothetical protein R6W68_10165 [Ignavibacteriaceae bacterium]